MNLKIQVSTVQLLSSQERFHVHTSSTILHCGGRGLHKQIGTARPTRTHFDLPNIPLGFYGIFMDPIFRFFFVNPIPTRHSFWGQFWTESGDLKCETLRPASTVSNLGTPNPTVDIGWSSSKLPGVWVKPSSRRKTARWHTLWRQSWTSDCWRKDQLLQCIVGKFVSV